MLPGNGNFISANDMGKGIKNRGVQVHKVKTQYSRKVKQPDPLDEGWESYRELVNTHIMNGETCLTHEDCHLNSFYPGKLYRKMKMQRNNDGIMALLFVTG